MLDPLSAASLAAAILQFVDFGSKIIVSGYETYRNTHGATEENVDLEYLTQKLYKFQNRLSTPSSKLAHSDQELQKLAQKCSCIAGDLLVLLDSLKVKEKGLVRTWEALRQSCRLVWKKDEIAKKEKLLDSITGQVNSRLLYMIRQDTSSLSLQIQRVEATCDELRVDLTRNLRKAQDTLLAKLEEQASYVRIIGRRQILQKGTVSLEDRRAYYPSLQAVPLQVNQFVHSVVDVAKSHSILRSLSGAEIGKREELIHEAYEETFDWIFDGDNDGKNHEHHNNINVARARFEQWLRTSSEVFWINGKAGSGKSTLMKYLAAHSKTEEILRQWAGDEDLVIAKHFFWNSGSAIQRSHVGLVQNLMYQVLQKCPELIPFASTQRWEADQNSVIHGNLWTRRELAASLKNIMSRGQLRSRFCFFIDGLDEYADENAGEHHELIEYLDSLAQSFQVKLCVSSRPWTVFKDRYEGKNDLTLVLQDLTSRDMHRYVEGILNNDRRFRQLVVREPQALDLTTRIRDRAEGVFLWVYLVVRSLLKGLSEHDDTAELERRLSAIPSDLYAYFLKIFRNIDPVYRREAMRAFQLSTIAMPLPLMAFKYISKEVLNPRYAFEMTAAELEVSDEQALDRANKWCRDLLEIMIIPGYIKIKRYEAYFLHRTVKDFLLTREMQTHLKKYPVCQSSPGLAMCMMYFAEIKIIGTCPTMDDYATYENHTETLLRWALYCEENENETPTEVLDEVGRTRSPVFELWGNRVGQSSYPKALLHLALRYGLRLYVSQCLDRDAKAKDGTLFYALAFDLVQKDRLGHNEHEIIAMITLLLEKGVDPNQPLPTKGPAGQRGYRGTTWEAFLAACYDDSGGTLRRFAQPWIHHGADLDVKVKVGVTIPRPDSPDPTGLDVVTLFQSNDTIRPSRRHRYSKPTPDVRTCLLSKKGHWPGMTEDECEREVDAWLAAARARRAGKSLVSSPEPSKRPSFRAKLKRLLARSSIARSFET